MGDCGSACSCWVGRGRQIRNAPFLASGSIPEERVEGGVAEAQVEILQVHLAPVCGTVKTVLGWESQRAVRWKDEIQWSDR